MLFIGPALGENGNEVPAICFDFNEKEGKITKFNPEGPEGGREEETDPVIPTEINDVKAEEIGRSAFEDKTHKQGNYSTVCGDN